MGVPVIKSLKEKHHAKIGEWIANGATQVVEYPDNTSMLIEGIIKEHGLI
jgi:hypothetical protein